MIIIIIIIIIPIRIVKRVTTTHPLTCLDFSSDGVSIVAGTLQGTHIHTYIHTHIYTHIHTHTTQIHKML